ncbi:hypothetical protein [Pseudanabaena sp. FACHB-2040]|uniref:hypothetical protein n=1 Tax=Pseudanabaena sp. FACHB-2040 TaxID=2692859 RepID=UPI00168982A2|nr:hypothetical protein [Pseudanabaena sp. FACHB-2040]MBD2261271.1 hypothetical protein [Pseudanabaena sp. FACHB-2040]
MTKIALLMCICEGELDIAHDALSSFIKCCQGEITLFLVDDASPSYVGQSLADRFIQQTGSKAHCLRLPKALKYRGNAQRTFLGLQSIRDVGRDFDLVVKLDADALVVREGLEEEMAAYCTDGCGLYGETFNMRLCDRVLFSSDLLPFGFKRKSVNGVIERRWQLSRTFPVWWSDFGYRGIRGGFRFNCILGSFWFMGWKTFCSLSDRGYFRRDQSKHGFVFNDDVLLTTAVHALKHPVVNLGQRSFSWKDTLIIHEETVQVNALWSRKPFVIHPLKNTPVSWRLRQEFKMLAAGQGDQPKAPLRAYIEDVQKAGSSSK